jgi:hypothetical protein
MFDKIDEFRADTIQRDLYFVETDNYLPMRCNGW